METKNRYGTVIGIIDGGKITEIHLVLLLLTSLIDIYLLLKETYKNSLILYSINFCHIIIKLRKLSEFSGIKRSFHRMFFFQN